MSPALSSLRGLYWKETRQIIPLIVILVGVALTLMTIWSVFPSTSRFAYSGLYIPLILPALYAAGAAALLVGQEKEQKTLWWLASLPTPASRLITVKFIVALVGLVVIWMCCWLLTLVASFVGAMPRSASLPFTPRSLHLHSVFILVCGFYTAWRLKNTFASLIAIIPLASIPLVVVQLGYSLREQLTGYRMVGLQGYAVANTWVTMVAIVVVGWLAYRTAGKNLRPIEPQRLTPDGRTNWLDGWRPTTAITAPSEPYRFSISSLVWQSIHHNRAVLAGIFAMLSFSVVCLALSSYSEFLNFFGAVLIAGNIIAVFAVSWLGVFVFTGDGSSERIRFLAELGTSPTQVWIGRQSIGISLLSIALLLFASLSLWLLSIMKDPNALVPSIALITMIGGVAYSVSQWTSQLLRILAASAFVAPVLSAVAIYWLAFAATEFDAPLWLLMVCGALPMFTTCLLMRRYMDGHRGMAMWLTAIGTVLLMIILPMTPLAIEVAQSPSMPASVRTQLVSESMEAWRSSGTPQRITLVGVPDGGDVPNISGAQALGQFEQRSFRPSDRLELGFDDANASSPATVDNYIIEEAIALATYEKLRFESSPDDESAVESVGQWITALTNIAARLRQSRGWRDQDIADLIEIWLTQTLSSESFNKLLDRDFSRTAIDLLADQQARNRARRRAILASVHGSFAPARFPTYAWSRSMSSTKRWLIEDRENDAITAAALRLIEDGAAGNSTEAARRELHEVTIGPSIDFQDGPYSDRMRVGADGVLSIQQRTAMYPCCHWFAPWETDAIRLAIEQHQDSDSRDPVRETP